MAFQTETLVFDKKNHGKNPLKQLLARLWFFRYKNRKYEKDNLCFTAMYVSGFL
jgi:hypothetical protein